MFDFHFVAYDGIIIIYFLDRYLNQHSHLEILQNYPDKMASKKTPTVAVHTMDSITMDLTIMDFYS